jgi:hypothetical protein
MPAPDGEAGLIAASVAPHSAPREVTGLSLDFDFS